jgi:hypothetical protein
LSDHSVEENRKEIFRALVELQDMGFAADRSRMRIANQFSISVAEVQRVEREGLVQQWPPLSDDNDNS